MIKYLLVLYFTLPATSVFAQSYSMPGTDSVRQHTSANRNLWTYCQKHQNTDRRCYAVYPRKGSVKQQF